GGAQWDRRRERAFDPALRIDDVAARGKQRREGMLLEERHAALEQPWVGDVVGGGTKDDLAAGQLEPPGEVGDGTEIARVLNQTGFGEPAEERRDDRNAVVGRSVIDDDQLVGRTGLRR